MTNQLITIDVINGVVGNTSGTDTLGGAITSPANAITSVTILRNVAHGTLTNTGLGTYTYRSDNRFLGLDSFTYSVQDSTGVDSKNTATCFIDVVQIRPPGVLNVLYTQSTSIYRFRNGVSTLLYTPTWPGVTPITPVIVNSIAVNREENLIYYVPNNGTTTGNGFLFAYDYANGVEFLVGDMGFDSRNSGATYYNRSLYIVAYGPVSDWRRITFNDYDPVAVSQSIITNQVINSGQVIDYGDLAYVENSNALLRVSANNNTNAYALNRADTGELVFSNTFTSPALNDVITGQCGINTYGDVIVASSYTIIGSSRFWLFRLYEGTVPIMLASKSGSPVYDIADWINDII